MEKAKKAAFVFKWLILGVSVLTVCLWFLPIYGPAGTGEDTMFYDVFFSLSILGILAIFTLALSVSFVFSSKRDGVKFAFGLASVYFFELVLYLCKIGEQIDASRTIELRSGFYLSCILTAVYFILFICVLVFSCIANSLDDKSNKEVENSIADKNNEIEDTAMFSNMTSIKQRLEILNDWKKQGLLNETEYEQKRAAIIKDLKM